MEIEKSDKQTYVYKVYSPRDPEADSEGFVYWSRKRNTDTSVEKPQQSDIKVKEIDIVGKVNKKSTVGWIFGVLAVFGFGLFGWVGFILCVISLNEIKTSKERGRVGAWVGLILCVIYGPIKSLLVMLTRMGY